MKTRLLIMFIAITSLVGTASADKVTTKEESDKYGPGGTCETTSENFVIISKICKDKCGRIREVLYGLGQSPNSHGPWGLGKNEPPTSVYSDENGKDTVAVVHGPRGDVYYDLRKSGSQPKMDPKEGQALVEKLEKTPSAPCPEPGLIKRGPASEPLPRPAPLEPAVTPAFNWTGPYIGIQFGYTRSSSDYSLKLGGLWNDFPDVRNEIEFRGMHEFDENGFGLGGCAGYNYQFGNNVVIGVGVAGRKFWGLDAMHETGDFPADAAGDFDVWSSFNTTGIVTFGPKAGYAFGRVLPYVSGGLAFGELDASQKIFSSTFGINEIGKQSEIRLGWNVAAGVQYAITNNWSVRMEYSYSDLGTFKYPGQSFPDAFHGFGTWHMATQIEHGANAGIVYTFH